MYAKRGGSRGGFRSAGNSKTFSKKRSSPEDDETAPASKKTRGDAEEESFIPQLDTDDDKNPFVAVSTGPFRCMHRQARLANSE